MNRKSLEKSRSRSAARLVRKNVSQLRASTPQELAALATLPDAAIDTSDSPERRGPIKRVVRDARGRIVRQDNSPIRAAIVAELERRGMSGHQLWKLSSRFCDTLPESAVYEFLAGKRQVGLAYLDAMVAALGLEVRPRASA